MHDKLTPNNFKLRVKCPKNYIQYRNDTFFDKGLKQFLIKITDDISSVKYSKLYCQLQDFPAVQYLISEAKAWC